MPNLSSSSCFSPLSGRYSTFSRQAPGSKKISSSTVTLTAPNQVAEANLLPLIGVLLIAGIGGGVFVLMKAKGKLKEAAKPDPDTDSVDDDEDFGYVEEEAEDLDFTNDSVDIEPV